MLDFAARGLLQHGPIAAMPCGASKELGTIQHRLDTLCRSIFLILFFFLICVLLDSLCPPLRLTLTATAY